MKAVLCPMCRQKIRLRSVRALRALKKSGGKLGSNNPAVLKGLKKLWAKQRLESKKKNNFNKKLLVKKKKENKTREKLILSIVKPLRRRGATIKEITLRLNQKKLTTKHGSKYHPTTVYRLLQKHHVS